VERAAVFAEMDWVEERFRPVVEKPLLSPDAAGRFVAATARK
jgi:hypothetical protein